MSAVTVNKGKCALDPLYKTENLLFFQLGDKLGHERLHTHGQRPEQQLWNSHLGQLPHCVSWW